MAKRLIGSFSFVVYGSAIVEHARDMAMSGEWMKAMNSLREAVNGFTLDNAMSVLSGEMTLEGNSSEQIYLVEDKDSEEYKQTMREVYIDDCFYENGEFYRFERMVDGYTMREMMANCHYKYGSEFDSVAQLEAVVRHLSDVKTEKVFQIHSEAYVVARKENPNVMPMWYKRSDYHNGYMSFYNTYYGYDIKKEQTESVVYTPKAESEEEKQERKEYINKMVNQQNTNYIESVAEDSKYDSVEAMSDKLANEVMQACETRNVTWEKITVSGENGEVVEMTVPREIIFGYLSRDHRIWNPVCESGLKMYNDSPWHSDLWLAMGHKLSADAYDTDKPETKQFYLAIEHYRFEKIKDIGDFALLNDAKLKSFEGRIVFEDTKHITDKDILVLPNAGLKYESIARKAGMVITETGGQLSHLVIVGKEEMFPVIVMKDALSKLKNQYKVEVDFENKKITGSYAF